MGHGGALTLFQASPLFLTCRQSFENAVGTGEIARNEQFLPFPPCFLPFWRTFCHFHQIKNCHLQTLSVWKSLEFVFRERVKPPFARVRLHITEPSSGTMVLNEYH